MYTRILVALDGSDRAERILPHVEALAGMFGAKVTLVRSTSAVEPAMTVEAGIGSGFTDSQTIIDEIRQEARDYVEEVAARLRNSGLEVDVEQPEGAPAVAILEVAQRIGADLLALTTHGRSGLGRLVLGSVADDVVRHASCPILLVRSA